MRGRGEPLKRSEEEKGTYKEKQHTLETLGCFSAPEARHSPRRGHQKGSSKAPAKAGTRKKREKEHRGVGTSRRWHVLRKICDI